MPFLAASNFLVPNATFIVELVAFLCVLGALAKWVLPVLNKSMDERQATIRQALVDAEDAKQRSEQTQVEYKRAIEQAKAEARTVIDEANRLAEQMKAERRQQAEEEYQRLVSLARADIDTEVRRASEQLRGQIADVVLAVVARVIGEGLDDAAHRALIDRTIAEVEAQASNQVSV